MIRITRQTDYGIILLTRLAGAPARVANAADLAGETGLPVPMVGKVLKRLAHEGLLVSQRGMRGGYTLARPPEAITLAEIVTVLEGPIAITDCLADGTARCDQVASCPTQGHWYHINAAVFDALAGLTLAGMIHPAGPRPIQITDRRAVLAENLLPAAGPNRAAHRTN